MSDPTTPPVPGDPETPGLGDVPVAPADVAGADVPAADVPSGAPASADAASVDGTSAHGASADATTVIPATDAAPSPAAAAVPAALASSRQNRHSKESTSKRTLWLIILAVVLVVAGGLIAYFLTRPDSTPSAQPDVTVTAPAPTLTVSPIAKPEGTAFFNAIPATVGTYALTQIGTVPVSPGALESYQMVYSDGVNTVTLLASQYADAATAETTVAGLATGAAAAPEPVKVGADTIGSMVTVPGANGVETVIWNNKTAVFQASGPTGQPTAFYRAMPL